MAFQSPMISIPKKNTDEVDWTAPIRSLISQSYGENPDNYATECAALQRCRQDAVRGAGSDMTARDLLYKYFGQLELLELRFSEIKVTFPWRDAFTNKLVTQTSIAYEKASILFQIAATHSAIAATQNRSDPESLKRAFYYFRTCAGMLTYINDNFLHAPSTDLSRDVIKFLVNLILAQATEVFLEKCLDEKKGNNALISKIGAQAAAMYSSLSEEVKEFMGKGIFDRNWITLIQIKSKYFTSLSQFYRGVADKAAGKYGEALVRFNLAETLAKEASKLASSFASVFVTHLSPNLPPDAGPSIQERTKVHLALCTERKTEVTRENDLIYNAVLPVAEALPAIDKTVVATPVPIQEVYGTPDVQKVIGPDLFLRLIPLSVHESASVYSEEKAKVVRSEVERSEATEGEMRSALESLGVKDGLPRFKAIADGEVNEELPVDVQRWKQDIGVMEESESMETLLARLRELKENVGKELDEVSGDLESESRDCENMRMKYEHLWTQDPSASLTKSLRKDLKDHVTALEAAATSDQQVVKLWDAVKNDINLLLSPEVEDVFRASAGSDASNILDLDEGHDANDAQERARIGQFVSEIEERLGRLKKISRERSEVLKDLKEKVQADDVSHLLLLNRRNTGVEPTLFAAELEKFRPYQQRLAASVHHQTVTIQEVSVLWKGLKDIAGRGPGARKWDEREKKKKETVRRFSRARDGYMEVRDGIAKGLQFYTELTELTDSLRRNVKSFVADRTTERGTLVAQAEAEKQRAASTAPPPPLARKPLPTPTSSTGIESHLASLHLNSSIHRQNSMTQSPQYPSSQYTVSSAPRTRPYSVSPPAPPSHPSQTPFLPQPPPPVPNQPFYNPPQADPYAGLDMLTSSHFSPPLPAPNPYTSPTPSTSHRSLSASHSNPQQRMSLPPPPPPMQPSYAYYQIHGQTSSPPVQNNLPSNPAYSQRLPPIPPPIIRAQQPTNSFPPPPLNPSSYDRFSQYPPRAGDLHVMTMVSADNLNLDVLELIFAYLPGRDLPSVALVSRSFLSGVIPRLYGVIIYCFHQCKRYPQLISPFTSILAHPGLAVHVRHVEIRAIPKHKGNPHPKFLRECTDALSLCKNLVLFKYMGTYLPPFLSCLQDKPRLRSLSISANLTDSQVSKLAQITGLQSLALEYASWQPVNILPKWIGSLHDTLREFTICMASTLNECVLNSVLTQLPKLRALHIVDCQEVDHITMLQLLKHVPLLESLAFSVTETPFMLTHLPRLLHLRHLAISMRSSHSSAAAAAILSAILLHLQQSYPPISSFVFRLYDQITEIPDEFIQELVRMHGSTLTRVAFIDCGVSNESLRLICRECLHLERLEVPIPVKDIIMPTFYGSLPPIPFLNALAKSSSLRTLIDRADPHSTHGPRPTLSSEVVRYMIKVVPSLRTIVNDKKVWTGTKSGSSIHISLERPQPSYGVNDWFLPRTSNHPAYAC